MAKKTCKSCKHFIGAGDFNLCCTEMYGLCYEKTPACDKFEENIKKKIKQIPKKYMTRGSYEGGGIRSISPIGLKLENLSLEELECPNCGQKNLYQHFENYMMGIGNYHIDCENCEWDSPATIDSSDCGDNIAELKSWLEAFYLMGKPKDKLNEDLTFYFYPEGEYRDKVMKYAFKRTYCSEFNKSYCPSFTNCDGIEDEKHRENCPHYCKFFKIGEKINED